MKRMQWMVVTALLPILLLAGCSKQPQQVTVELAENPTTGYGWSYVMEPAEDILTEKSSEYIGPKEQRTGAGGTHKWVFEAAGDGEVTLTFTYSRPWAPKAEDEQAVYTYTVKDGVITQN